MSWQSEKEEDQVFNSLSERQKQVYFAHLRSSGGDVEKALDATVGKVWFDKDGDPVGRLEQRRKR